MKFSFFLLFILLFSCSSNNITEKQKNLNSSIKYAKHFNIIKKDKSTVLQIFDPETHRIQREYIISKESLKAENNIVVPIKSIIPLSSTHVGMLSILESLNVIVAISDSNYVYNPFLLKKVKTGKVSQVGGEGMESTEKILKLRPTVLMYSGFGKEFHKENQLEKLGVNCIPNYDWRELHPLGKAEWIKVFGCLLGKEKEANDYFKKIENEYFKLASKAKLIKHKKSIISGHLVGDIWFAPAGESYNAQFYKDANINYVYTHSKGTGSIKKSLEEIVNENKSTDYWLNCNALTLKGLVSIQKKYEYLVPFQKGQVYDYTIKGQLFWEMSAIEPHKVLSDLINIVYPSVLKENKLYFYSQLK